MPKRYTKSFLGGSVGQQREVFGGGVEVRRPSGRSENVSDVPAVTSTPLWPASCLQ
jgi:hypothetical protein